MTKPQVAIVGAGQVGATTALWLAKRNLADLILVDVVEGLAAGKALDLQQAGPLEGFDVTITGSTDLAAVRDSAVVVITAGLPRTPGMSREDLLTANANIVRPVVETIQRVAPHAILIIVTNPLDVMTALAAHVSGFPRERVIGMAGILDSARLCHFVSQHLRVPASHIAAMVLGSHGDEMVPLLRYTTVAGQPLTQRVDRAPLEHLLQRTRDGGAEIVRLLKQGSAFAAPGASVAVMVEAIVRDTGAIYPCSVSLEGEYGLRGVFLGVPVALGRRGIQRIVELELTPDERAALHRSAAQVQAGMKILGL